MSKPTLTIVRKKISDLHADPANANRHPENNLRAIADSLHAFGQVEPLVVQKGTGKVIGGNGRLEVLRNSGAQEVDVVELDIDGTQATALAIALNRTAKTSEFDDETLASLLQSLPQECQIAAGFDANELQEVLDRLTPELPDDQYSRKIKAPIYEPKGDKPKLEDLFDRTKTSELINEIDAAKLPDDIANFLRIAAERHTVFHFARIAEWYCHATPEQKRLMEKSAMVIIDFDAAIENGFVQMTERLASLKDIEVQDDAE